MFSSLHFENFRSIRTLDITNLSRINVFFGKNNCGKTTVLESIFMLCGLGNPQLPVNCNNLRGYRITRDLSFFFNNFDISKDIVLCSEGTPATFQRRSTLSFQETVLHTEMQDNFPTTNGANNQNIVNEVQINATIQSQNIKSSLKLRPLKDGLEIGYQVPKKYKESIFCNYFAPSASFEIIIPMIQKVFKEKQEVKVLQVLQKIDNRIKDFVLINNDVMVDIGLSNRIPINMLGDGVRKFLSLIVALHDSANGILLVDEIDNGLHFSSMQKLWEIILEAAESYNVQLFATTHNIDSLKGLAKNIEKEKTNSDKVSLYKILEKEGGAKKALHYDASSFVSVIEQENEVR